MVTLLRGPYFTVQHFQASRYVRVTRTELPFKTAIQVIRAIDDCRKALECIDLSGYGILLDWRLPPMTTDPLIHQAIVKHVDTFAARFERRAILVKTPVGKMQVARVGRTLSDAPPVLFNDDDMAISYVAWRSADLGA